ncbi:hypothetical protein ASE75_04475 [Sphingomonas sp. Leaf17]|nr:hypothetical protein ASE75_04475 [Sphingomonas sp. Leaf17]
MRLIATDAAAQALGLMPGLTLADARVRVPDLVVVAHDPVADRVWLERLADGCLRYTPQVALDPPDGLILDIAGCVHPFGGAQALAADVLARLDQIAMTTAHALAATPDAARALARHFPRKPEAKEALRKYASISPGAGRGAVGPATASSPDRLPNWAPACAGEPKVVTIYECHGSSGDQRLGITTTRRMRGPAAPPARGNGGGASTLPRHHRPKTGRIDHVPANAGPPSQIDPVHHLPVAALRLGEERTTALIRAGLKTIGDVARRPLAGIAARFGADAVHALRRMTGEVDSPLIPHRVPPAIQVERRFAEPIASTDYALAILAELAAEAAIELDHRHHGGRAFAALFFRSDGQVRRLAVETGMATRDPLAIMRLFRERIAGLDDPLDPGFGYDLVQFAVARSEALSVRQIDFDGRTGDHAIAALIDRLSTRIGRARLRRFAPGDSHLPERAQRLFPAIDGPVSGGWGVVEIGEPPLRPLHLFDPPQVIEAIAEVPDGPPLRFRWRSSLHDVTRFEGPERIAAEWWRRRDGAGLTRDYYRVEDSDGRRFWIFRHGLYGDEVAMPGWYLHGLFA